MEKNKPHTLNIPRKALFLRFLRLGMTAFGGPAMVAYIRQLSVDRMKWLEEDQFRGGVALVQSIPGATAMQMAGYVGLKCRGLTGGICSYAGFALPAFTLMVAFSAIYARTHDLPNVAALFAGLQVIVVAIVASAAWSFGRNILKGFGDFALATAAALLLWFNISPFIVIAGAAVLGLAVFGRTSSPGAAARPTPDNSGSTGPAVFSGAWRYLLALGVVAVSMALLFVFSDDMFEMAALLMRIDIFAFGGGFTALPLMLHEIVDVRQWMDSRTFMDGVALGQVTPGPIVITSTFIGYQLFGLPGGVIATLAMLTPSFLIMAGVSPFFDRLKGSRWVQGALRGIVASFVGLLVFVMLKFAIAVPWDLLRALMGIAALAALLRKVDVLYVVLAGAALSWLFFR